MKKHTKGKLVLAVLIILLCIAVWQSGNMHHRASIKAGPLVTHNGNWISIQGEVTFKECDNCTQVIIGDSVICEQRHWQEQHEISYVFSFVSLSGDTIYATDRHAKTFLNENVYRKLQGKQVILTYYQSNRVDSGGPPYINDLQITLVDTLELALTTKFDGKMLPIMSNSTLVTDHDTLYECEYEGTVSFGYTDDSTLISVCINDSLIGMISPREPIIFFQPYVFHGLYGGWKAEEFLHDKLVYAEQLRELDGKTVRLWFSPMHVRVLPDGRRQISFPSIRNLSDTLKVAPPKT